MNDGASGDTDAAAATVPVLLLKTKSVPADAYEEYFTDATNGNFAPSFIPVLEHRFTDGSLTWLQRVASNGGFAGRNTLLESSTSDSPPSQYGGLIFTSQRAVELFSECVKSLNINEIDQLLPPTLPLYVVGPATARGLRALHLKCPLLGEETGNGEALAAFMLDHYNSQSPDHITSADGNKLPLLFLVGEQRRDIIPKTLQSADLPASRQIPVTEVTVYETGEMQSFAGDFTRALGTSTSSLAARRRWIVVFSPTGCRAMLRGLGWLDDSTGRYDASRALVHSKGCAVATIGPTTRDFLLREFGFEPHVCADKPSPEGVGAGIQAWEERQRTS